MKFSCGSLSLRESRKFQRYRRPVHLVLSHGLRTMESGVYSKPHSRRDALWVRWHEQWQCLSMQFRKFVRRTMIGDVKGHVCSEVMVVARIREEPHAVSGSLSFRAVAR
jgi:hypothetical protein